jgi:Fe-S cluster assembly protein SufD
MVVTKQSYAYDRETVEAISRQKSEPAWMRAKRLEAWEAFDSAPWPTTYTDEWRRTDLRGFKLQTITPFVDRDGTGVDVPEEVSATGDMAQRGGLIVQRNSSTESVSLRDEPQAKGAIFCDLETAVRDYPDLVQRALGTVVANDYNKFTALNGAFWSGGTFLYVPSGADVALPLQASFWAQEQGSALFPRTLIVTERDSRVTYIDQFLSTSTAGEVQTLNDAVVELSVGPGSVVRYISLQQLGMGAWNFQVQRARIAKDAKVNFLIVGLGSTFSKANIDAVLEGQGSETEMLGFYFPDQKQFADFHTLQEHVAPHTTSDLLFKGALKDKARSVFSGLINVHQGAQKTNAYQNNKNLLLSSEARSDSNPKLEIGANDVRCTHGATIGQLEEEQVFYLMCRGVPRVQAERLIVEGFFDPILQRVPLEGVRERLRTSIDEKIV